MICPSSNDERSTATEPAALAAELAAAEAGAPDHAHCLSYVYVGQALTLQTATADHIVAYEPLENHDGDGVNVLFGDGHVEFFVKGSWKKLASDAGIALPDRDGHITPRGS
jgi:prepilin-type processing-associated H-X9-DG protein